MRGLVKVSFAGKEHVWTVNLRLVPQIETATDRGLIVLANQIFSQTAQIGHVAEVLRAALNANGHTVTTDEVLDMADAGGVLEAYVAAGKVLGALFERPKDADASPKKAKAAV